MPQPGQVGPACKCCGGATRDFGSVDASRSCEDHKGAPFPPAGWSVSYRVCDSCGFVFTADLDGWSEAEMAARIYNADYVLADPEFVELRPAQMAQAFGRALAPLRGSLSLVDYGGGAGVFAARMREAGYRATTVDPYFAKEEAPRGAAPLVTAFEVVEHSRTPVETFAEALSYAEPGGVLVFSTALRPPSATIAFPYIAPRNGHVSIHSDGSLAACAARLGRRYVSLDGALHMFLPVAEPVAAVGRMLLAERAGSALYAASRRGAAPFAATWREVARVTGAARLGALLDPRHPLRALRTALAR
jgi:2-polyprenyl-6-hydroxyphenyl methylase/3-demethylubiquinone-9 3-methyltransferase